jgi:hypothetical protein
MRTKIKPFSVIASVFGNFFRDSAASGLAF